VCELDFAQKKKYLAGKKAKKVLLRVSRLAGTRTKLPPSSSPLDFSHYFTIRFHHQFTDINRVAVAVTTKDV
jgi:hypothetical protein